MNKEIMEYREAMFFGLDFRQMACSLLAVAAAVGIYFSMRRVAGDEVTGWLCMAGAAPFAFCGFFRYHGMTAEQFVWAFIKSEFLYPKKLLFQPEDLYYQCMKERISDGETGKKKRNAEQKKRKRNQKNRADRKCDKKRRVQVNSSQKIQPGNRPKKQPEIGRRTCLVNGQRNQPNGGRETCLPNEQRRCLNGEQRFRSANAEGKRPEIEQRTRPISRRISPPDREQRNQPNSRKVSRPDDERRNPLARRQENCPNSEQRNQSARRPITRPASGRRNQLSNRQVARPDSKQKNRRDADD